jgi:hypothetical protein
MHIPIRKRPTSNASTDPAKADSNAPIMKSKARSSITKRRPKRSASQPPKPAARHAPARTALVTTPCISVERAKVELRNRSAPEMTPVS